jgi:hypothetical protein
MWLVIGVFMDTMVTLCKMRYDMMGSRLRGQNILNCTGYYQIDQQDHLKINLTRAPGSKHVKQQKQTQRQQLHITKLQHNKTTHKHNNTKHTQTTNTHNHELHK